jgi:hypothetical protein
VPSTAEVDLNGESDQGVQNENPPLSKISQCNDESSGGHKIQKGLRTPGENRHRADQRNEED